MAPFLTRQPVAIAAGISTVFKAVIAALLGLHVLTADQAAALIAVETTVFDGMTVVVHSKVTPVADPVIPVKVPTAPPAAPPAA